MGDHRASILIEFTMHGVTTKADMWLNWSADCSMNSAVEEWFEKAARKSMHQFDEDQFQDEEEARKERASKAMG